MPSELQEVRAIFTDGGLVMAAIALVAVVLYGVSFAAYSYVSRGNLTTRDNERWRQWINDPASAEGRVGDIIRYILDSKKLSVNRVHRRFDEVREVLVLAVDRRLVIITTLIAAAPMTGLLGTVIGMLEMFAGLSSGGGKQSMQMIASGMKQALFTTLTGLVVALPGMFMATFVRGKRNRIEVTLTQLQAAIVSEKFKSL